MAAPASIKSTAKRALAHRRVLALKKAIYRRNLSRLALACGSDKQGSHFYTQHYQRHFSDLRNDKINLLEIGIGGYDDPQAGGDSLRMWKAYFPNAQIFGIDIYDKSSHNEKRITCFQGSQIDEDFLKGVTAEIGVVDIIIDDGSHLNEHVVKTFEILFPRLAPRGIYAVEDTQTSYWIDVDGVDWGGSSDLNAQHTSMNYFKSLVDGLNYEEFQLDDYVPTYFDRHIVAMHMYHNLVFVQKGDNNEGSNAFGRRFRQ
jgi:hypothetical protein